MPVESAREFGVHPHVFYRHGMRTGGPHSSQALTGLHGATRRLVLSYKSPALLTQHTHTPISNTPNITPRRCLLFPASQNMYLQVGTRTSTRKPMLAQPLANVPAPVPLLHGPQTHSVPGEAIRWKMQR